MIHITTINCLRAGIDAPPMQCHICKKETMYLDWVSSRCDTCGADTAWLEESMSGFIRSIRNFCGITRQEIAEAYGCKHKTIKAYEWGTPSKKYIEWFKKYIEQRFI